MTFEITDQGTCIIEGIEYPAVGFGTYRLLEDVCFKAIMQAAEVGYRILDTATFYKNFDPIGKALKKLGREDFYLISKVWPNSHTPELLVEDLHMTLEQLQTSYLDTYFLHWPNSSIPIEETLGAMDKLRKEGMIRHLGLSNVTVNHLKRALEVNIPISWVQVEMNPLFYDAELLDFCRKKGILVQAWAPLERGNLSEDIALAELGEKYNKTASQIAIRWILQHHCLALPGSKNPQHMIENLDVMDFTLSQSDMEAMNERAKHGKRKRLTNDQGHGFADEFDFSYEECWPK